MKRLIPFIALAIVLAGAPAWAADATATLDAMSAYVWRGITVNDSPVLQPSLDVSKNGFGANVWANYDLDEYYNDAPDDNEFSEVDLTLYYGFKVSDLEVTVGVIQYLFPAGGLSTREVYGSLSYPLFGGLSAGFDFYYDFDMVDSYYTDLGLTYAMELMDKLNMEVGAKLGYAGENFGEYYSGGTEDGFYDCTISGSLTYALAEGLNVGAKLAYTESLDSDVLADFDPDNGVPYGHDVEFYGGLTVSYAF
ncbi:MAG: MltA-interacting MipA family protein [Desulfobacterales bacterium]|nr:MltA-interacting MipA family protein [Desulfobacterales bacterium]